VATKPVEFLKQLGAFWNGLSNVKRIALVLAVATVMVGVAAIAVVGSRVEYAYLYSDIDAKEAGSIVQKLETMQVPFKVEAGGTAIRVPAEQVHALRATLAKEGLPSRGDVGNELFDQARLGATEFEQEVNLRRALEGELSRSILEIAGVAAARVHLVIPKRRLFAAKSEGAQASVVLTLRSNVDFGRNEVAAIVHLVTMAVPNLTPDRVTVVDSKGNTLHRPDSGKDGSGVGEERANETREQELRLSERTQTLLEKVAGPGAVEVRIKLDFDSAAREQTKEQYDPTVTALRSENKVEERTATEGATVAGVPGAQTNLPDIEPSVQPTENEQGGNFSRRSHIRNWEVDRVVEKLSRPAGDILRVSVGVLVDGRYEMREGQQVYVPRSAEELEVLRNVVKGAVGFDAKRGDTIELQSTRFYRDNVEAPAPLIDADPKWLKYVVPGAAGLGALLLLSSVVLVWRKRKQKEVLEQQASVEASLYGGEENARLPDGEPRLLQPGEEVDENGVPMYTPEFFQQRKVEAIQIATADPATAAIVLREWLTAPAGAAVTQGAAGNG
jgi:flagellar M-ring protein FliF